MNHEIIVNFNFYNRYNYNIGIHKKNLHQLIYELAFIHLHL